jgi:hypothetical protein
MYTLAFDIPQDRIQMILATLQGEMRNMRLFRAKEQPIDPVRSQIIGPNGSGKANYKRTANTGAWVLNFFDKMKPWFEAAPDRTLRYDDPRIVQLLIEAGKSPNSLTPMLSEMGHRRLLVKAYKGSWRLP